MYDHEYLEYNITYLRVNYEHFEHLMHQKDDLGQ